MSNKISFKLIAEELPILFFFFINSNNFFFFIFSFFFSIYKQDLSQEQKKNDGIQKDRCIGA